jgi:hypothetical protein
VAGDELNRIREFVSRAQSAQDDIELITLRTEGDVLRHRLLVLQSENRALRAALSVLKNEGDW